MLVLNILSGPARLRMRQKLTETHYGKNDYIFREGNPTDYFPIVKDGTEKCVTSAPEGKECTLKMLTPGNILHCDTAAFDGSSHPGSAQPMEMSASSG